MKDHNFSFKPGFAGSDVMRSNAERLFAEDIRGSGPDSPPKSKSARDKEPMRPYKKGGHVTPLKPAMKKKCADGGAIMQTVKKVSAAPMAMGGVGKIRHKEMTKSGKQIAKRGPALGR